MQDVMIDIETLDTSPSAVILSIGAVRFDVENLGAIGDSFHRHIDIESNLKYGRTVSGSTILWWLDQDAMARKNITSAQTESLYAVLGQLGQFIKPNDRVWGNGASFDNVILGDAYRRCDLPQPWRYWSDMCYRTLKNVYKHVPKPKFEGVEHDALDDARYQALHLQAIYQHIKQK